MWSKLVRSMSWRPELAEQTDHPVRYLGRHWGPAVNHFANAFQQAGHGCLFQQIPTCAGAKSLKDAIIIVVDGQDQRQERGIALFEQPNPFDTGHAWQSNIDQHDMGKILSQRV